MELRQALADLAEVRGRLASVQRFEGYSGGAAIASGAAAILVGVLQYAVIPSPTTPPQLTLYLTLWLSCLAMALVLNYGAIVVWYLRHRNAQAAIQMRTVGMSIAPAIAAGGVITAALVMRGIYPLLPGLWCATYALGIFSSRASVPRNVVFLAAAFGLFAAFLLLFPAVDALEWWVMPLAFGFGQIAIGLMVSIENPNERGTAH
ncbi:MAG TPA: hypothetical protein VGZ00_02070 [Candidatus Baltobacteraceae bacterium]|jgi:hypothetical protein|nr:hypothetical protein [Candidatus Baltobacteraceae bacterium]